MKTLLATLVGATLMATVPAQAATDMYLAVQKAKGESINGDELRVRESIFCALTEIPALADDLSAVIFHDNSSHRDLSV